MRRKPKTWVLKPKEYKGEEEKHNNLPSKKIVCFKTHVKVSNAYKGQTRDRERK